MSAKCGVPLNRMGRDMVYDCWSCDLLCAASSPDIYRINLEQVLVLYNCCYYIHTCVYNFVDFFLLAYLYLGIMNNDGHCDLQGRFLSSLSTQSPALNVVSRRL